jgi:hypothetical protein
MNGKNLVSRNVSKHRVFVVVLCLVCCPSFPSSSSCTIKKAKINDERKKQKEIDKILRRFLDFHGRQKET